MKKLIVAIPLAIALIAGCLFALHRHQSNLRPEAPTASPLPSAPQEPDTARSAATPTAASTSPSVAEHPAGNAPQTGTPGTHRSGTNPSAQPRSAGSIPGSAPQVNDSPSVGPSSAAGISSEGATPTTQDPTREGGTIGGVRQTTDASSRAPAEKPPVPAKEVVVAEVPEGAIVPAIFFDETVGTPQQLRAMDRIKAEFGQKISNRPEGVSERQNWEEARRQADAQYKKIFGGHAYNQMHLAAAKEAVKEKKQATPPPATPAPTQQAPSAP